MFGGKDKPVTCQLGQVSDWTGKGFMSDNNVDIDLSDIEISANEISEDNQAKVSAIEVDEDLSDVVVSSDEKTTENPQNGVVPLVSEDLGDINISTDEENYKKKEQLESAKPIVKEAVSEAIKIQNENFKLEVSEVLQDEVGYRLNKYEKRRRWREIKERICFFIKAGVVIILLALVLGNTKIRTRLIIVGQDIVELFSGLFSGEDVSSNQLIEDMFRDLGDDLDKVNTTEIETTSQEVETNE